MAQPKTKPLARRKLTPLPAAVSGLLSRRQVCEALGGISTRKLDYMIAAREFPAPDFTALGTHSPRWTVTLINDWIARNRVESDRREDG